MAHNRKLVLSGASLTHARVNRQTAEVGIEIMDELEQIMISTGYLEHAPFKWVGLTLRFGLQFEDEPHFQEIDENDGEIALAIELDTHDLVNASRDELKDLFMIATLKTLVHVGIKYNLPHQKFDEMLVEKQLARTGDG